MTTLVTGAGLIGTAFAQHALARGEKVVFLDPEPRADFLRHKLGETGYALARGDVRNLPALIETIKANGAGTLVHTAGLIGPRVQQSLSDAFDINLAGTRNVAEAVRLAGVRRLVHISTLGVYDTRRPGSGAISEDSARGGVRGYGNYKAAQELMLDAYGAHYGFELIMLRPANVFGFGHFWAGSSNGRKMHALVEAGLSGRPARIAAADTAMAEYVYAKDVGRAVDLATTLAMPADNIFNIGTGVVSPFTDVLAAVQALFPAMSCEVEAAGTPKSRPSPLDISRAKRQLDWEPQFTLKDAFADYLAEWKATRVGD
jgi:nucleoside-diphosphate-sugar epimerase